MVVPIYVTLSDTHLHISLSEPTLFHLHTQVGEAEKLVRTLFMVAVERQPSVIFMDEVLVTNLSFKFC